MNPVASEAVPPGVVIATALTPAVPAGVFAVTLVELTTTTFVAGTPPTVTEFAPVRFVPVIVIAVLPSVEPLVGLTVEIVGGTTTTTVPMTEPETICCCTNIVRPPVLKVAPAGTTSVRTYIVSSAKPEFALASTRVALAPAAISSLPMPKFDTANPARDAPTFCDIASTDCGVPSEPVNLSVA